MSGIYIPSFYMEMPECCLLCPFMNGQWQTCKLLGDDMDVPLATRRSDCPLIPVPDHGRLIDADVLRNVMFIGEQCLFSWDEIQDAIDYAPTIIPVDRKDGAE